MAFKFEQLVVWQLSVDLSEKVNGLCKIFPKDELYVLTSQIKRAADSVSLNIAEGSTGQSNDEFKKISWLFDSVWHRSRWMFIFGKETELYFRRIFQGII